MVLSELLEALAIARWQMLLNGLRRDRSKRRDLAAKIVAGVLIAIVSLGMGLSIGALTYATASRGHGPTIALWMVFGLWLVAQVIGSTVENHNFREIARYPISFPLFCLLQAVHALLDPVAVAAAFWLLCAWISLFFAKLSLVDRAVPMLAGFWLVTLLLNRVISEVVERFTSTKKGRRRLITAMVSLSFAYQFFYFGRRWFGGDAGFVLRALSAITPFLPPGVAAHGIHGGRLAIGAAGLAAYAAVMGVLLLWIYHRKYQGELLSDAPAPSGGNAVTPGWQFPLLSNTLSALVEKEFRYMLSQPMGWLNSVYGPLMAVLMSLGMARNFRVGRDMMFPLVVGLVILVVGARAYNSFGFDLGGFNRYLLAPPDMRQVLESKNLLVALLLAGNFLSVAAVLAYFAPFSSAVFFKVLAGFVFAVLAALAAGNFLSVRFPIGIDLETMRAKNATTTGQLGNLGMQFAIAAVLATVFYKKLPALPLFTGLAVVAGALYWLSLDSAARYAERHSEEIARSLTG